MRRLLLAAAAASSFAAFTVTPALAGDLTPFMGGRVEVIGGWDQPRLRYRASDLHKHTAKKSGGLVGVQAGYDFEYQNFLIGAETEYAFTTMKKCETTTAVSTGGEARGCVRARGDFSIGVRAGGVIMDKLLAYAKVDFARGHFKARGKETNAAGVLVYDEQKKGNSDGVRFGGGVEYLVNKNFYGKLEYRYTSYGHKFNRNQLVAGIGVRF